MIDKKTLAALAVAGAGALFLTRFTGAVDTPGHEGHHGMSCPAHVEGAQVQVTNTEDGAIITITGKAPEVVKAIQAAAAHMAMKEAGCSCCNHKAKRSAADSKKGKGKDKEAVYGCPMGCYKGPNTKDGRCPKCGMDLHKQ